MRRAVSRQIRGEKTQDGAGVSLVRVLGSGTAEEFDPILLLDSLDSTEPADYLAGFPMHPHRGIETISYICRGKMLHRDSLGHEDAVADGEVQWMTAGSGIVHEERLPVSERLLGVQLWLNLPAKDKMAPPAYHSIKRDEIAEIAFDGGTLRLLAGNYRGRTGFCGRYLPLDYYDIRLEPGASIVLETARERAVMVFTLSGEAIVGERPLPEKTAAKLTEGDEVEIKSAGGETQILWISSLPLDEPVTWSGPIVMNTRDQVRTAFDELSQGTFLKSETSYE